jgi:hypothetical protein
MSVLEYAKDHLSDIAKRSIRAHVNFVEQLQFFGGIDEDQAEGVFSFMQRKKMIVLDLTNSRYTVKHGGYLDREFIEHLAIHGAF